MCPLVRKFRNPFSGNRWSCLSELDPKGRRRFKMWTLFGIFRNAFPGNTERTQGRAARLKFLEHSRGSLLGPFVSAPRAKSAARLRCLFWSHDMHSRGTGVNANAAQQSILNSASSAEQTTYPVSGRTCLLYTSPSPRDQRGSRMPSSA